MGSRNSPAGAAAESARRTRTGGARGAEGLTVLVCSDTRLYREALSCALARKSAIEVVAAAADPEEAMARATECRPDAVLCDVVSPAGRVALFALAGAGMPNLVAFGLPDNDAEIIACAEAGVSGLVTHDQGLDELAAAIESVARGETHCSPQAAAVLLRRVSALASPSGEQERASRLTSREREVVQLIDEGLSNKQIAQRLTIELPTVKNHVHNILEKLRVARRGEAAASVRTHSASGASPPSGLVRPR